MLIIESIRMAMSAILTHKLRSFLTLLGVIIGVMTIIGMMTIIRGLQLEIEKQMTGLTADVFQVQRHDLQMGFGHQRRDQRRPKLTLEEALAIKERCELVSLVGPETWQFGQWVAYRGERTNPNISVGGGYPEFATNNGYDVAVGRFITYDDVAHSRRVIVIGDAVAKKLFPFKDPLGKEVRLERGKFRVIGVFAEAGTTIGSSNDNHVCIPFSTHQKLYGKHRSINITIKALSPAVFHEAQEEVIGVLRTMRGLKADEPDNFAIWSPENLIENFNQMSFWIKVAAIGICGISLLVAGIGIMNIMLVSVTERTREIGVRMAIGAKKMAILSQFLVEAVILSEVGGCIGVLFGVTVPIWLGKAFGLPTAVPIWSIVLGLLFCSFVGIVFGMWPAVRAARLDPVEALRYE